MHDHFVEQALDNFLDTVERMDMGPLDHFTCSEAEALADLMLARRGDEAARRVILHHFWGSDEEHDELREHIERWPGLDAQIRALFSDDLPVVIMLNEIEEDYADGSDQ